RQDLRRRPFVQGPRDDGPAPERQALAARPPRRRHADAAAGAPARGDARPRGRAAAGHVAHVGRLVPGRRDGVSRPRRGAGDAVDFVAVVKRDKDAFRIRVSAAPQSETAAKTVFDAFVKSFVLTTVATGAVREPK